MEELLINKIENGIRAIKLGTQTLQDANINSFLTKLKPINIGMYLDLQKKYVEVVKNTKK